MELDEYAITVRVHTYNIIINHMGSFVQPKIVRTGSHLNGGLAFYPFARSSLSQHKSEVHR